MNPEDFVKQLEKISEESGIPYRRAHILFDKEEEHEAAALKYKGYLSLSDAFKCFFLETVELLNAECIPKVSNPISDSYSLFVPRLTHAFQSLCGTERISLRGYPYHGYTLLRNTFDSLVLMSAAIQRITDFYSIEGIDPGKPYDEKAARKFRKDTETNVRRKMTGNLSGLTVGTVEELSKWDSLFDLETHGGRLSLTRAVGWMSGKESLAVLPQFEERASGMFMNRFGEISWMLHRLLPHVQPPGLPIPGAWKDKWNVLDDSFRIYVSSLTEQLNKPIGAAVVELVTVKFPFNADSNFPSSHWP